MCDGLSDYFFLNDSGGRIQYKSLLKWFNKTLSKLNIQAHSNTRKPTMQCFRHTFAVNRLTHWCEQGEAVQDLIPHLSVYLGHVNVEDSYWYLTATPALLVTASDAFSRSVGQE
jgi:integrase